jgi:hypothetical protein
MMAVAAHGAFVVEVVKSAFLSLYATISEVCLSREHAAN